jgi:hypothetical protein
MTTDHRGRLLDSHGNARPYMHHVERQRQMNSARLAAQETITREAYGRAMYDQPEEGLSDAKSPGVKMMGNMRKQGTNPISYMDDQDNR